jgi:hypothetical protein
MYTDYLPASSSFFARSRTATLAAQFNHRIQLPWWRTVLLRLVFSDEPYFDAPHLLAGSKNLARLRFSQ